MDLVPAKWTKHHTHRMFHLSFFIVALVMSVSTFYLFGNILFQAAADYTVDIAGSVPSVQAGPSVPAGPGGGPILPATPPNNLLLAPTVTIKPGLNSGAVNKVVSIGNGKSRQLWVFTTDEPSFAGYTNIKGANIFLEVRSNVLIRGSTSADADGNWTWQLPEPLSSGLHTIKVTSEDPQQSLIQSSAQFDFYLDLSKSPPRAPFSGVPTLNTVPTLSNLFNVLLKIPAQLSEIAPGDQLFVVVKLLNLGTAGSPVNVPVYYLIKNDKGDVISESTETVAVAGQISLLKTFYTSSSLPEGQYTLIAEVPSKDILATSSVNFMVKGNGVVVLSNRGGYVNISVIFQALIAMLFLFILIVYFEYNKISIISSRIKQITEKDMSDSGLID